LVLIALIVPTITGVICPVIVNPSLAAADVGASCTGEAASSVAGACVGVVSSAGADASEGGVVAGACVGVVSSAGTDASEGVAGEGVAGEGVAGEGVAGEGVAGEGVAGEGVAGEGVAGEGVAGEGVAGEGVAGEGVAGEGEAGADVADGVADGVAGEGVAGEGVAGEGVAGEGVAGEGASVVCTGVDWVVGFLTMFLAAAFFFSKFGIACNCWLCAAFLLKYSNSTLFSKNGSLSSVLLQIAELSAPDSIAEPSSKLSKKGSLANNVKSKLGLSLLDGSIYMYIILCIEIVCMHIMHCVESIAFFLCTYINILNV
jgi:hypothetical protein